LNATATSPSAAFGFLVAAFLYERSLIGLVVFAVAIQLVAVPIFLSARRSMSSRSA
jgi:hypothetical protein